MPSQLDPELHDSHPSPRAATRSDHQNISFTAKLVALGRSTTKIPFARDVSELIGAPAVGADLARAAGTREGMPSNMAPLVEVRYLALVSALKRSGVRQVLEFASGVSLRGLAMTLENPTLTYIETDLPDLTAEKQRIMDVILARRALQEPDKHFVAVANILAWHEIEAVLALLAPGEPVAVIHEGLFMYLDAAEKAVAAQHIGRILDRFGGLWLTPDFSSVAALHDLMGDDAGATFGPIMAAIEERTGRTFAAHSFNSDDDSRAFCEKLGFQVEEHSQIDGSFDVTSLSAEQRERGMLTTLAHGLKLWEMRRT